MLKQYTFLLVLMALSAGCAEQTAVEKQKPGLLFGNFGAAFQAGKHPEFNDVNINIPLCYGIGFGYAFSPRITIFTSYDGATGINILPTLSQSGTEGTFTSYNLGVRFRVQDNIYLTGGGGLTHITSNSIFTPQQFVSLVGDSTIRNDVIVPTSTDSAPADTWKPTVYGGIGIANSIVYFELRHTVALSKFPLANGEMGTLGVTSLVFGLNLHF